MGVCGFVREGSFKKDTGGGSLLNLFKLSAAPQLPPPDAHFYLKRWKRV